MSNDDGMIKGVADTVGTNVITIVASDAYGLTCQMTFTISVKNEEDLVVLTHP